VDGLEITVAIPSIPIREKMLRRAMLSIGRQNLPATRISVALDMEHRGAAVTRQCALDAVETPWVAFLDDDDYLYPRHLEALSELQEATGADYLWSWFDGNNPFPQHRGRQMDVNDPHHTTMTVMVRTELAKEVGFSILWPEGWKLPQEDWQFITGCVKAGAKFAHTPEVTWHYSSHLGNTCGLGDRW
jgi:glycosyltransferase involved in cell wall biosynthesis